MNLSTLLTLVVACLLLVNILQNIQLYKINSNFDNVVESIHILEDEFSSIQNEHELFLSWFNDNDVMIAVINDSNQKRKAILANI
jgi:hypothetical protein